MTHGNRYGLAQEGPTQEDSTSGDPFHPRTALSWAPGSPHFTDEDTEAWTCKAAPGLSAGHGEREFEPSCCPQPGWKRFRVGVGGEAALPTGLLLSPSRGTVLPSRDLAAELPLTPAWPCSSSCLSQIGLPLNSQWPGWHPCWDGHGFWKLPRVARHRLPCPPPCPVHQHGSSA